MIVNVGQRVYAVSEIVSTHLYEAKPARSGGSFSMTCCLTMGQALDVPTSSSASVSIQTMHVPYAHPGKTPTLRKNRDGMNCRPTPSVCGFA